MKTSPNQEPSDREVFWAKVFYGLYILGTMAYAVVLGAVYLIIVLPLLYILFVLIQIPIYMILRLLGLN